MRSDRVSLINCDEKLLKAIIRGDEHLSKEYSITVPNQWSEFGKEIFEYSLKSIKNNPSNAKWFSYLPIETKTRTLIGSCGYKGKPNAEGMVEIGYEVAKDFRNKGYATEIAKLLIKMAFEDSNVKMIQAHTLTEKNASVKVLEKCEFQFIGTFFDEDDGQVWRWVKEK